MKGLNYLTKCKIALAKGKIIEHVNVLELDKKIKLSISPSKYNDFYVFENYEEYKNYYNMYIDVNNLSKELIDNAIFAIGKKGQIVVFKGLCEKTIINQQILEFYQSYSEEKVSEIHSRNKNTPYERVLEWESYDLCTPGDAIGNANYRCEFFNNCHECLLEYASCNEEYDKFNFKLINYDDVKVNIKRMSAK